MCREIDIGGIIIAVTIMKNVIPIMYGYPAPEALEEAEKGNLKLGGCEIYIDDCEMPDRYCKDCEFEWSLDRLRVDDITKVRFRYWSNRGFYDPDSIHEDQWAFEMFPDGVIKYYAYSMNSRRVRDRDKVQIEGKRVIGFYESLLIGDGLFRHNPRTKRKNGRR